jgi:hypothetical protein
MTAFQIVNALFEKIDKEPSHTEKQVIILFVFVLRRLAQFVVLGCKHGFTQKLFTAMFRAHKGDANDLYLVTKLITTKEVLSLQGGLARVF